LVKSSICELEDVVVLNATEEANGTFTVEMQLNTTALTSAPIDDLYAYYVDEVNAAGNPQTIIAHAIVRSVTGAVSLDKSAYLIDEWMNVTVTDADQNQDPDIVDSVTVKIYSDSWPLGETIALSETGSDTGVFSALVQLVDEIPTGNRIMVALGDTITVNYTDPFNAAGEEETIMETARVGAVVEYPVPASEPFLTDTTGAPVIAPEAGKMLLVQANITNEDAVEHSFVFLAQVKDENGVVIHLAGSGGTIAAGAAMTPFVSWTPPAAGTYTVEVYVWKSLPEPEPLSLVATYTFVVLE